MGNTSELELEGPAWARFAADHWKRTPTMFQGVKIPQLTDEAEIFGILKRAGDGLRAGTRANDIRLLSSNGNIQRDIGRRLPSDSDPTLSHYLTRASTQLGGTVGIMVNHAEDLSFPLFQRVRLFLQGLFGPGGVPLRAELVLFYGNYASTPYGIHKDDKDTVTYVVKGRKRLLTWPYEYFEHLTQGQDVREPEFSLEDNELLLEQEAVRASAHVLEGGPGTLFYFPNTTWHVAADEKQGETLALSLFPVEHDELDVAQR